MDLKLKLKDFYLSFINIIKSFYLHYKIYFFILFFYPYYKIFLINYKNLMQLHLNQFLFYLDILQHLLLIILIKLLNFNL